MRINRASGFYICDGKGFHITFANRWTLSVQFGPANYCDHYDRRIGRDEIACGREGSSVAEVAVISPSGELVSFWGDEEDTVKGRVSPDEVAGLVAKVSELQGENL